MTSVASAIRQSSSASSVPNPKFALSRGEAQREFLIPEHTSNFMNPVRFSDLKFVNAASTKIMRTSNPPRYAIQPQYAVDSDRFHRPAGGACAAALVSFIGNR